MAQGVRTERERENDAAALRDFSSAAVPRPDRWLGSVHELKGLLRAH